MGVKEDIYQELSLRDQAGRAAYLDDIFFIFYNYSKFDAPGGMGLDGRDGPERASLAKIYDLIKNHRYDMLESKHLA